MSSPWRTWVLPLFLLSVVALGVGGFVWLHLYFGDEEARYAEGFADLQQEHRCQPGTASMGDDHSFSCVDRAGCQVREAFMHEPGVRRVCPPPDAGAPTATPPAP